MLLNTAHPPFSRFLILWSGQLISSIGSGLTAFALGIYLFELTGSATHYSLIIFAAFLPTLLLKPMGGTLADRMDRRWLMMIGDIGSAAGIIFILLMMFLDIKELWVVYLGTVISSIFVALQNPAYKASVTDLVNQDSYSKASGLMQLAESSKYIISPIIAGFLFKMVDIKTILLIDAATFIIAVFTIHVVKIRDSETKQEIKAQHFMKDLMNGFNHLYSNKSVFLLVSVLSIITFFVGLLQALLGPMILSFSTAEAFGTSLTLATTGMLLGSFFIGLFGKSDRKIALLSISLILVGLFFSLIGIVENIAFITLFGFLFFLTLPFVNTSLDVLIRSNVENHMQGRVWAIISLVSQLGMAMALGTAGFLAEHIFNPLLTQDGVLASSVGAIIGTGKTRGIGLIFVLSGLLVVITAIVISRLKTLKKLDALKVS